MPGPGIWSQQRAADAAGVSRRFVNMLERGDHANAEVWRVLALLDALGVRLTGELPAQAPAVEAAAEIESPADTVAPDAFDLDAHLSGFRNERNRP